MIDLSTMHGNKKIWIDRISLDLLLTNPNSDDSIKELADKVLKQAFEIEKETHAPCMEVPVRVHQVRKLFPESSPFSEHLVWGEFK